MKWVKYIQNDILAIGYQKGCPSLKFNYYLYINLDGSFLHPNKAGVIQNPTPITKNTLLKA